ncbi:hypothetical protein Tco_1458678 [Tanacetum coccineum]
MSKVLYERAFGSLPRSTKANSRDHVKSISTTVEADTNPIRCMGSSQYAVYTSQSSKLIYETRQTTIPFPKASVSVMLLLTYLSLGLGKLAHTKLTVELADRTVKYPMRIVENVLVGVGLREHMELDLEARLMGETLVLNRSLDPLYGDYIELNDLNVPLELRRDQVYDLMPTIEEVVENMDGYRDQDIGDIILGEPFFKASCVEARRFNRLITIHNDINTAYAIWRIERLDVSLYGVFQFMDTAYWSPV